MSNDHWQQDILDGETVGGYCIEGMLGKGGMGEVYRARDPKLQRDVAIKILPSAFAKDPGRLSRFHREARLLASLNHPNIASIYGFEDSCSEDLLRLSDTVLPERCMHIVKQWFSRETHRSSEVIESLIREARLN